MNNMYTAKYSDYLISLAGACVVAFGLGAVLGKALGNFAWVLVVIGALVHAWGMYQSHGKKS
jgi:hypothetical protein